MNTVYILLGSNQGDREGYFEEAKIMITNTIGNIIVQSSIYETEPWGFEAKQSFLNQVIIVFTEWNSQQVLKELQNIEESLGRIRSTQGYTSRSMDLDILFYNDEIIEENNLCVPHPQLHNRLFTLVPLNEVASDKLHPQFNKSIKSILEKCQDTSDVKLYNKNY